VLSLCQRFYINYHKGISHFLTLGAGSGVPSFDTIAQWKENPSSKIDILIQLLTFLLEDDDRLPPMSTPEGEIHWPTSSAENQSPKCKRKILVYQEFSSMAEMLCQVCNKIPNFASLTIYM
jgi:hypothetical protein